MSKLKRGAPFSNDAFSELDKLQLLDISKSCTDADNFQFPDHLRILKMNDCKMSTEQALSNIEGLIEFHAENAGLREFPNFHPSAPLEYLDFRSNDIEMEASDIAPFCQVKKIRFQFNSGSRMLSNDAYCDCTELESWMVQQKIEHDKLECHYDTSELI